MKLDIPTLAFVMSLIFLTQVVALSAQYRINRASAGVAGWLAGTGLLALGFILTPLVQFKSLVILAMLANPMVLLGYLLLYAGTLKFTGRQASRWKLGGFYGLFLLAYYFFIFVRNEISGRAVVVSAAIALVSLATAWTLFFHRERRITAAAHFTAAPFLANGLLFAVRTLLTFFQPPMQSYQSPSPLFTIAYVIPFVASTLWTFGFILMVNQRLNAENLAEREALQRVASSRLQAEEALRESEETYRSILDASPDDITITDLQGRILLTSPVANTMFGYPPGTESGLELLDFLVPEERERASANILLLFQGRHSGTHEYRALRRDGTVMDIEVNSGLVRGPQGQPNKLVFVVRDISGRNRLAAEKRDLEARNRQLQKAESLGRMAGAIAHHFNNQLQVVLGNLELVSLLPKGTEPDRPLARAKQAAERSAEVSKLMLAYLGQTSGEQEPRFLAELCRTCQPALQAALPEGVELQASLPSPGPMINANAAQIQQVLTSLVTNAWEAMGSVKGSIRISLDTGPAEELPTAHRFPVDWQPQGGVYASLAVADAGSGISAADLEKVFDPFFSTRFTGRGLGLPVVLGFVQAHGGAVSVASRPGQGSVFSVHFPVLGPA